ncbi:MAG: hypothetical protein IPK07_24895 [Deltaproteobacteria bacterium]|nr:hypothetical protein [Deltaproteobacteria bacterium]
MKRRVVDDHAGSSVGVHAHHQVRLARFLEGESTLGVGNVQVPVTSIEGDDVGTPLRERLVQLAHTAGHVEHPAGVEAVCQELREDGETPQISHFAGSR